MRKRNLFFLVAIFPFLTGWGHWGSPVKIGLALDHTAGREILVKKLREDLEDNRAELQIKDAQDNFSHQESQVRDLLSQGIQALILLPVTPSKSRGLVEAAHKVGIKVISLERLVPSGGGDYLVAYDEAKGGTLQAKALAGSLPKGRYVLLEKDKGEEFHGGQIKALKSAVDRGDIQILRGHKASRNVAGALRSILKPGSEKADALLAPDSSSTEEAFQALEKATLKGKLLVAGVGEDLAACRRIHEGTQILTVYRSPLKLAAETAYLSAKVARKATTFDCQFVEMGEEGFKTKAVLLTPKIVDAKNLESTIIKDGLWKKEEVFEK